MDTSQIPAASVSAMEVRVLGPIEVFDSGNRLDIGGRKQKTVLAMLVANAGRPVSTDRLIDAVYGEFSEDRLYFARGDGESVAIDRSTGDELWTLKGTRHEQIAPSGSVAAAVTADGNVTILDLVSWENRVLDFGFGRVRGLAFGPEEDYLAVGGESDLHIVDLRRDVLLQTIPIPLVSDVYWIDDTTIAFGTREGLRGTLSRRRATPIWWLPRKTVSPQQRSRQFPLCSSCRRIENPGGAIRPLRTVRFVSRPGPQAPPGGSIPPVPLPPRRFPPPD